MNVPEFLPESGDFSILTDALQKAGLENGAIAVHIDTGGTLPKSIRLALSNYLIRIVNPNPLF